MYIERDINKWTAEAHLLVKPTAAEQRVFSKEKRDDRIAKCLVLGLILWAPTVVLLLVPHLDRGNGWHLALLLTVAIVPLFALGWLVFYCGNRANRLIDKMTEEDRAFRIHWRYYDTGIGNTLMKHVLFTGERALSADHMREVVEVLDPSLLDQFLIVSRHIEVLRGMSNATSAQEREAWRALLDSPALDALLAATQPEVDHLRALEAEQREIAEINQQAEVRSGLLRVQQFEQKNVA